LRCPALLRKSLFGPMQEFRKLAGSIIPPKVYIYPIQQYRG
jgi:hypothetical protein